MEIVQKMRQVGDEEEVGNFNGYNCSVMPIRA